MSVGNAIQVDGGAGCYSRIETIGSGVIYPGYLLEHDAATTHKAHATEGGRGLCIVAVEDALQGKTCTQAYASGDRVQANIQRSGTRFQGILKAGESVTPGTALISNGAGCLIALASASSGTTVNKIMTWSEETLDLTASDAEDTLICVRAD